MIFAAKEAVLAFPKRPLRATHALHNLIHPLRQWAEIPTLLPPVAPFPTAGFHSISDDEDDDDSAESLDDEAQSS